MTRNPVDAAFANVLTNLLIQGAETGYSFADLNPHIVVELLDADGNVVLSACELVDLIGDSQDEPESF